MSVPFIRTGGFNTSLSWNAYCWAQNEFLGAIPSYTLPIKNVGGGITYTAYVPGGKHNIIGWGGASTGSSVNLGTPNASLLLEGDVLIYTIVLEDPAVTVTVPDAQFTLLTNVTSASASVYVYAIIKGPSDTYPASWTLSGSCGYWTSTTFVRNTGSIKMPVAEAKAITDPAAQLTWPTGLTANQSGVVFTWMTTHNKLASTSPLSANPALISEDVPSPETTSTWADLMRESKAPDPILDMRTTGLPPEPAPNRRLYEE